MVTRILILILLLALAFVLSAAEVALYAITGSGEPVPGKLMSRLFRSPQLLLSTILVSNAFAVFLFTLIGASVAVDWADAAAVSKTVAVVVEVVVVSGLLVLFADAVPKLVAFRNSAFVVKWSLPLLLLLLVVESPVVYPLNSFLSWLKAKRKREPLTINSEGLKTLSGIAENAGVIEEHEAQLLRKISFLGEKRVRDTMTPRKDLTSVAEDAGFEEVVVAFRSSEHSRIPVYSGSLENVVGMLYARDFLPVLRRQSLRKKFTAGSLMRVPVFVPETQSLEKLLETYRAHKVHIAVVVDEFGGLSGIVTLSDVVREVFGSSAEMPREGTRIVRLADESILAKGSARVDELAAEFGPFDFDYDPADTVSSLLIRVRGSVPRVGSKIPVGSSQFEVVQATPKAILQVRLRQLYSGSVESYE